MNGTQSHLGRSGSNHILCAIPWAQWQQSHLGRSGNSVLNSNCDSHSHFAYVRFVVIGPTSTMMRVSYMFWPAVSLHGHGCAIMDAMQTGHSHGLSYCSPPAWDTWELWEYCPYTCWHALESKVAKCSLLSQRPVALSLPVYGPFISNKKTKLVQSESPGLNIQKCTACHLTAPQQPILTQFIWKKIALI